MRAKENFVYHFSSFILSWTLGVGCCMAQAPETQPPQDLKKLSIEELMNIEVTSVSKKPEKLTEVPSAIQVITSEDIRRSGATCVPEALRLASNLFVAQVNSSQWAISARGFNNVLSDKLLVLIDGRTVYTPLYAGVYWDVQNLLLEDVDRIEVISGPGGTLWGSNAVNGVINITTKSAQKTQGLFAEAGVGSVLKGYGGLRYGGKIGNVFYRAYGMTFNRGSTINSDTSARDRWWMAQGGVRADWQDAEKNSVSLISNFYHGRPDPDGGNPGVNTNGSNIVARWSHKYSETSESKLQAYYDQTWRDLLNGFAESLRIYDLDWQHRFQPGQRHAVVWGAGARIMDDRERNIVTTLGTFEILPAHKVLQLYNFYAQDNIAVVKDRVHLTLGAKLEHNVYTAWQFQPNGRLAWTPHERHTIWAAASRAVRTPSRIDRDFSLYLVTPSFPVIVGGDFRSETLTAYELGYRVQPVDKLALSLATFYNFYDYLRSVEPSSSPTGFPYTYGNGVKGTTYGGELSGTYQVTKWWHLRGGYTVLRKDLTVKPDSKDLNKGSAESNDPHYQLLVQSTMDIPGGIELGGVFRYVDRQPKPYVSGYKGLDVRIGWRFARTLELNLVGQNLLARRHTEFIPSNPSPRQLERGGFVKLIWRFRDA